jgi:hypothetical protein
MAFIEQIAYHLGRRDEDPNKELAARLVEAEIRDGIDEIAGYLHDKNKSIQSDCIAVLYHVGYLAPHLISKYAPAFIELLDSKTNRMVWGSMIALSTIAGEVPEAIWPHRQKILDLVETGSVITNVSGVRTLINLIRTGEAYYDGLIDDLLRLQSECRNIDFAKRAEEMAPAIRSEHREAFLKILTERKPQLSKNAQKRLDKVLRSFRKT